MRVTNYKRNAQALNEPGGITTDDQLTRRFYVLDAVTGVSAGGGGAASGKLPEAVRYLRSAKLFWHASAHHGASLSPQVRYLRSAKLTIIVKSSDGTPSQVSATDDLDCH